MCGNTQIPAASMKKAIVRLCTVDKRTEMNGFDTQFHVSPLLISHMAGNM